MTSTTNSTTSNSRIFGLASSTTNVRASGIKCFNAFQDEQGDPKFEDLEESFVENDNLHLLLRSFAEWLAQSKIPQVNSKDKFLEASTKVKYWGGLKDALMVKFNDHEGWSNFEEKWAANMRDAIMKESKRAEYEGGTDSQDDKTRAIYLDVKAGFVRYQDRTDGDWTTKPGRDLMSILNQMMKSANQNNRMFERRCIILLTYFGVGRGGEAKFLRYDDCTWDNKFEHFELFWRQMKTLKKTPLTFGSCPPGSECEADLYHAFACYYAVDDGLLRSEKEKSIAKFIFPILHQVQNESVASKVTSWLRTFSHSSYKKSTTAKSLRKGANNYLAMKNNIISDQQRRVRGCWEAADHSENKAYRDVNPSITFPPFCALAGWMDPTSEYNLPMRIPPTLPESDINQIQVLHNNLYTVSKAAFLGLDWSRFMEPFLWTCTAAAVLYYPKMVSKFGMSNPMVAKMTKVMMDCNHFSDVRTAVSSLNHWSDAIAEDFKGRANKAAVPSADNLLSIVAIHANVIQQQQHDNKEMTVLMQQLLAEVHHLRVELQNERQEKKHKILEGSEVGEGDDTEADLKLPPAKKPCPENRNKKNAAKKPCPENQKKKNENEMLTLPSKPAGVPGNALGQLGMFNSGKKSSGGLTVAKLLENLHTDGQLARHANNLESVYCIDVDAKTQPKVKYAMQLIDTAWSKEQKEILCSKKGTVQACIATVAKDVEIAVVEKMLELERGEEEGDKKKSKAKPFVIGLGSRYEKYLKSDAVTKRQREKNASGGGIQQFLSRAVASVKDTVSPKIKK